MSDIVLIFSKNRAKTCFFTIFFGICIAFGIMLGMGNDNVHHENIFVTALILGRKDGVQFFFAQLFSILLSLFFVYVITCNKKLNCCWFALIGFRVVRKVFDVTCALKIDFAVCFISCVLTVLFELILLFCLTAIHFGLSEKEINVFKNCDWNKLRVVELPISVISIVITIMQSIIVPIFIF